MTLLNNFEIFPSKEVLQSALGEAYSIFEDIETQLTQDDFGFSFNWYYSIEIKSWMCKVCGHKKNIFLLSVGAGYIKTIFVFSEKDLNMIAELNIDDQIKNVIFKIKPIRNMFTVSLIFYKKEQLADLYKIIGYKVNEKS